jgi:hypothetical protein
MRVRSAFWDLLAWSSDVAALRVVFWCLAGGRGGRGRDGGRDRPKTQEQLDYEMDLISAERDGRDVEAVKATYRAKKEEAKKAALDSQMVRCCCGPESCAGICETTPRGDGAFKLTSVIRLHILNRAFSLGIAARC